MPNVQSPKCDRNVEFFLKKIGKLEATLNALIAHLGLEIKEPETKDK